jgi:hypothetical protein
MFSLARLLGVRRTLEHFWADTEVAPPDTVLLIDDERVAAAEAEWFTEGLLSSATPATHGN